MPKNPHMRKVDVKKSAKPKKKTKPIWAPVHDPDADAQTPPTWHYTGLDPSVKE